MSFEISRRDLITRAAVVAAAGAAPAIVGADLAFAEGRPDHKEFSQAEVLAILKEGNKRWAAGKPIRKSYAPKGSKLTDGQWPIAAVLGCADSRVQPDEFFDLAPANLFVVRNAGNVVDDDVYGSLEYAIEHLGVQVIVVLGHSLCGAVKATEAFVATGAKAGGHIDAIIEKIAPAVRSLPATHTLGQSIHANADQSARQLLVGSEILAEAQTAGHLSVVAGAYNLGTKKVSFHG